MIRGDEQIITCVVKAYGIFPRLLTVTDLPRSSKMLSAERVFILQKFIMKYRLSLEGDDMLGPMIEFSKVTLFDDPDELFMRPE